MTVKVGFRMLLRGRLATVTVVEPENDFCVIVTDEPWDQSPWGATLSYVEKRMHGTEGWLGIYDPLPELLSESTSHFGDDS